MALWLSDAEAYRQSTVLLYFMTPIPLDGIYFHFYAPISF